MARKSRLPARRREGMDGRMPSSPAGTTRSILDLFVGVGVPALPIACCLGPLPRVPEVLDDIISHAARDGRFSRDPNEAFAVWQRVVGKRRAQQRRTVR